MGAQAILRKLSVEDYLADPSFERFEWVDGVAVETGVGNKKHSRVQVLCVRYLDRFLAERDDMWLATVLRCRLIVEGAERYRQPDLAVVAGKPSDGDPRFLEGAPLLAIEIRSPDDTVAELLRKTDEYLGNGCKMAWLILPDEESVLVRTSSGDVKSLLGHDLLGGAEVLPGFTIEVSKLFA
ncbi:MAG: Uma2 family endonuclease [Bryobacterales bacterium]